MVLESPTGLQTAVAPETESTLEPAFRAFRAASRPNISVQATAYSLRSCVAAAFGGACRLALSRQDKLGVSCRVKVPVG